MVTNELSASMHTVKITQEEANWLATIDQEELALVSRYEQREHAPIIGVYVLSQHFNTLNRAKHLLQRDMSSHLVDLRLSPDMLYAELYALETFSTSESIGMYHYCLQRALGPAAQVWLASKGGTL